MDWMDFDRDGEVDGFETYVGLQMMADELEMAGLDVDELEYTIFDIFFSRNNDSICNSSVRIHFLHFISLYIFVFIIYNEVVNSNSLQSDSLNSSAY